MAKILFVDDDFFTLETYEKMMSLFGHEVVLAETSAEALQLSRQHCPDLIILDMNLPDMDGFELLRTLKADAETRQLPAVMVSANPEAYALTALNAGAQYYLTKPIRIERLLEIIEENS